MSWPPEVIELFKDELAAFDKLDPKVRKLVTDAPVAIYPMCDILYVQQTFGVEATMRAVKELIKNLSDG